MTDAPLGNVVYGTLSATLPMPRASLTGTVRAMAEATAEAIHPGTLSTADVPMIVAAVVAELERRRARPDWRDWRDNFLAVIVVAALIVAWLDYRLNAAERARPEIPPSVTVVAPQSNITVVVPSAPTPQPDDDPGSHPQERRSSDR